MTPCEKLGYKVGDKFEVVSNNHFAFNKGEIISLSFDDDTHTPYFNDNKIPVMLSKVKKINDTKIETKDITIPCPEGYEFDGIRAILKGEHYLSEEDYKTVNTWRGYGNSDYPYIALKKKQPDSIKFADIVTGKQIGRASCRERV